MTHTSLIPHDSTIHDLLHILLMKVEALSVSGKMPRIYGNKALMELIGIKDRYLKRLRDNGLLGYSRYGDKYWYTQADVDHFLSQCHYAPFGNYSMNSEF